MVLLEFFSLETHLGSIIEALTHHWLVVCFAKKSGRRKKATSNLINVFHKYK